MLIPDKDRSSYDRPWLNSRLIICKLFRLPYLYQPHMSFLTGSNQVIPSKV